MSDLSEFKNLMCIFVDFEFFKIEIQRKIDSSENNFY